MRNLMAAASFRPVSAMNPRRLGIAGIIILGNGASPAREPFPVLGEISDMYFCIIKSSPAEAPVSGSLGDRRGQICMIGLP